MDVYDKAKRSYVMGCVKSKDTDPEMAVRRRLHALGYRYRTHVKLLSGKPDIVFTKRKKVVFIHGCFWHQHADCKYAHRPASNISYWESKLNRNMVRDSNNLAALRYAGWEIFVVWECELREMGDLFNRLTAFLGSPRVKG